MDAALAALSEVDEEITLSLIVVAWVWLTSPRQKAASVALAAVFAAIEFFFWGVTEWGPNDEVLFTPQNFSLARCHTTWAMFFANILYAPILLYGFRWLLRDRHWLWLVVLFPFNVWVAEVLIGYYLLIMWETRAWIYKGADAYFHGNVKLWYYPLWMGLGIAYAIAMGAPVIGGAGISSEREATRPASKRD